MFHVIFHMFLSLNVAAFCRLLISSKLGCCHVPGGGVDTTLGEGLKVVIDGTNEEAIEMKK